MKPETSRWVIIAAAIVAAAIVVSLILADARRQSVRSEVVSRAQVVDSSHEKTSGYVHPVKPRATETQHPSDTKDFAVAADEAAKRELKATAWVRDVFVSPGHMNVGVIVGEKDWKSPMVGRWVCSILAKHRSDLTWVRFVDIQAVASRGQTVTQAEIAKFACRE